MAAIQIRSTQEDDALNLPVASVEVRFLSMKP